MKWGAVGLLIGVALMALGHRVPEKKLKESEFRPLLLRPAIARTVSKPVLPMLVDVLWLRMLNAIGQKDTPQKSEALHEYGVALTETDPRFYVVYKYVGLNAPVAIARNTWAGADLGSDMFRRGLKAYPDDMTLLMYLGFNLFHRERKFAEASDIFAHAATLPGALDFMAPLAVRLKAHSGDAREALALTVQLLEAEKDEAIRGVLAQRLDDLQVEIVLQDLDKAAAAYAERTGQPATELQQLRDAGLYAGPPLDPLGGELSLKEGKGHSTSLERRVEIYE